MSLLSLLSSLGSEITDPEEESFLLFSQPIPSQNLGFVDSKAHELEVEVNGTSYAIQQSPALLASDRKAGTTGAVLWKITPLLARFFSSPSNPLFQHGILNASSTVLELGCGISGVLALTLGPKIKRYILSDQAYVFKPLLQNLELNFPSQGTLGPTKKKKDNGHARASEVARRPDFHLLELDWEISTITSFPDLLNASSPTATATYPDSSSCQSEHLSAIIACDCIYNPSLIRPFVRTCADLCSLSTSNPSSTPAICIIAQQLRAPDVFEEWLKEFWREFRVWRLEGNGLEGGGLEEAELGEGTGMCLHVGLLRSKEEGF